MSDFVLIDGDLAMFASPFGEAVIVVRPGKLVGSGPGTVGTKPICVAGDEAKVEVENCLYATSKFPLPGSGTLKISGLADDQTAKIGQTGKTAMLLKGSKFKAEFTVKSPAKPPPSVPPKPPDNTTKYSGSGSFVTKNTTLLAD
jgi:hypothetical protein